MTNRTDRSAKNPPVSNRGIGDQVLGDEMERLLSENYGV